MTVRPLVLLPFRTLDRNRLIEDASTEKGSPDSDVLLSRQQQHSPRIYLECSATASIPHVTGIQRVVRNIIIHHQEAAQEVGVEAYPAQLACDNFYGFNWQPACDATNGGTGDAWDQRLARFFGDRFGSQSAARFGKMAARVKKAFRFRSLRREIQSNWLHQFATPLHPREGDLMVLIDATWGLPLWPAIQRWREQGGKVVFGIHDILPITHPQFMTSNTVRRFTSWFEKVVENSDLILAVSNAVRDQLREYVQGGDILPIKGVPRIESFRLGSDLDMHDPDAPIRRHIRAAMEAQPQPYLMVGTLEPRKNHRTVLDAFDRLWQRGQKVRLILVGRRGWNCDDIEQRLLSHPRLGKDLFWFQDLTDSELHYCYEHARALLFASFVEGFGLPVVEGLQHGLPVIASDLPVHRESAGNFAAFFDPNRAETLEALVEQFEIQGSLPSVLPAKDYQPFSWRKAVTGLLQQCRNFANEKADNRKFQNAFGLRRAA